MTRSPGTGTPRAREAITCATTTWLRRSRGVLGAVPLDRDEGNRAALERLGDCSDAGRAAAGGRADARAEIEMRAEPGRGATIEVEIEERPRPLARPALGLGDGEAVEV